MMQLLLKNEVNVNAKDKNQRTILHEATSKGYDMMMKLLLKNVINVDAKDKHQKTTLREATSFSFFAFLSSV